MPVSVIVRVRASLSIVRVDAELVIGGGGFSMVAEGFNFEQGVAGIGDELADEDILIGIEPFFDDRENVFRMNF